MTAPGLSVIVPNWNGLPFLPALVEALGRQTLRDFELVVVDNGSADGSRAWLEARADIRVVALERNHGFAGGMNRGIAAARAPLLVLLNNDMAPEPGFLAALVAAAGRFPEAGSFAARVLCADPDGRIDSAGDQIGASGRSTGRGRGEPDGPPWSQPCWVFGATGGAALWRREALLEAGGFDPDFFLYIEDTDLAFRAQLLGWRCRYVPEAVTRHLGSASLRGAEDRRSRYCLRNHLLFLVKDYPVRLALENARAIVGGIAREFRFAFTATRVRRGGVAALGLIGLALGDALRLAPRMAVRRLRLRRRVPAAAIRELFA